MTQYWCSSTTTTTNDDRWLDVYSKWVEANDIPYANPKPKRKPEKFLSDDLDKILEVKSE